MGSKELVEGKEGACLVMLYVLQRFYGFKVVLFNLGSNQPS